MSYEIDRPIQKLDAKDRHNVVTMPRESLSYNASRGVESPDLHGKITYILPNALTFGF
jgi:hypothetical protein